MKRLIEIFKYGDSEPIEIWLSIFLLFQMVCYFFKLETFEFGITVLISVLILASIFLIRGSIVHSCNLRKISSYIIFVSIIALLYRSIVYDVKDFEHYILLGVQAIGFMWISWKNATEEKLKKTAFFTKT